jgi:hypothetical protein
MVLNNAISWTEPGDAKNFHFVHLLNFQDRGDPNPDHPVIR